MIIKYRIILIIFLIVFMLNGCKDLKEVDRITFPVVLGVDWNQAKNDIKIYVQISNLLTQPGIQAQSSLSYSVLESDGKTLRDAMFNLVDHAQQYISWKQIISVVFTDRMAKHGIRKELDVLSRNEQIHLNSYLIITSENLKELLEATPMVESGLATTITGVSLISSQGTHSKPVTLKDFLMDSLDKEKNPVIPRISIYRKEKKQSLTKAEFDYKGLAVFMNYKLVGWMNEKDTFAFLAISGISNQGAFSLPKTRKDNTEFSASELSSNTKYVINMVNNRPEVNLKISMLYDIYQLDSSKEVDLNEVQKYNDRVAAYVKDNIEKLISKAQNELKADVFGLGGEIYRKYPQYWMTNKGIWTQIFREMNIKVEVKAKLRDTGELSNSIKYNNLKG